MARDEIGEILSDILNRISFLENSLPGSAMSYHPEEESQEVIPQQKEEPWRKNQWYRVEQLLGEMANLKRKFATLEKQLIEQGYLRR